MKKIRPFVIALLGVLWVSAASALETAPVRDIFYEGTIVLDPGGDLTVEEALARARGLEGRPRQRVSPGGNAYWLVETVSNPGDVPSWWVEVFAARSDYIDLYVLDGGAVEQHVAAGLLRQATEPRMLKGMGSHVLPFTLPAGQDRQLALRVQSRSLINYSIKAGPDYALNNTRVYRHFTVYALMGGMLFLILYNLFLGVALREPDYFLYSAHGTSYFVFFFNSYGFAATLMGWTAHPWITVFAGLAIEIFGIAFVWRFLRVRDWSPVLHWLMTGCLVLLAGLVVATPFVGYLAMAEIWMLTYALVPFLVLAAAIAGIVRGRHQALYILLGWTPMVAMTLLAMVAMLGYLARPPSGAAINASVLLEMLVLSLALADRVRQLRSEREWAIQEGREKSNFLAMLSHEVRTPLNGIMGTVELLGRSRLDRTQKRHVSNLRHAGNALMSLLNDVLQLAKSEAGRTELHLSRVALVEVTRSMCDLMSARAAEKGLELDLRTEGEVPAFVTADEARLRQVLLNLIGNAVKFTDAGRVGVVLRGEPAGEGRTRVAFEVEDTGIGIAPQDQERLFRPFVQIGDAQGRAVEGTGLGLSICRDLVQAMGGTLEVDSRPGRGSRFHFALDLEPAAEEEPARPQAAERAAPASDAPGADILVVDDVELNRAVLKDLLGQFGHRVAVAASGAEALDLAARTPFDVVVSDIFMPGMDGFELARALRKRNCDARLVGLTAAYDEALRVEAASAGFDLMLAKPVGGDALNRAIGGVLDLRRSAVLDEAGRAAAFEPRYLEGYCRSLGKEHVRALVARLRQTVANDVGGIETDLRGGDVESCARRLHKLAGVLAMVGMMGLGHDLETTARDLRSGKDPSVDVDRIRGDLTQALSQVEAYLDGDAAGLAAEPA